MTRTAPDLANHRDTSGFRHVFGKQGRTSSVPDSGAERSESVTASMQTQRSVSPTGQVTVSAQVSGNPEATITGSEAARPLLVALVIGLYTSWRQRQLSVTLAKAHVGAQTAMQWRDQVIMFHDRGLDPHAMPG